MGGGQHRKRRINVLELKFAKYAALTFTRRHPTENTYTNRKQSCPFLCSKNGTEEGGAQKTKTFATLEVFIGLRDQNYCRVLYRDPAKTSRLSIKNYKYSMQFKKYEGSQT